MKTYAEVLEGFQTYMETNFPKFNDFSVGNMGEMLLEMMAYYLEAAYYEMDATFREAFLRTATNYENVVTLARQYGYDPFTALSAVVAVTLTATSTGNTLPLGTEITALNGEISVPFFLPAATVISESPTIIDFLQGNYRSNYSVGRSDGTPNQVFTLPDTDLVYYDDEPFITVTVGGVEWTPVSSLYLDMYADSNVVEVFDAGDEIRLVFGDGTVGNIPTEGDSIVVSYGYNCMGDLGNIPVASISSLPRYSWVSTATNDAQGSGGRDRETIASVRSNAYNMFSTQNRAVTRADLEGLAETVAGVRSASVTAVDLVTNTVTLQISFDGTVAEATVISEVEDLIESTKLVATTVTLTYPLTQNIYIGLTVNIEVGYESGDVQADIDDVIDALLLESGSDVYLSDVYAAVAAVEGVDYAVVNFLTYFPSFESDEDVSCSSFTPKTTLLEDTTLTITCDGASGYSLSSDVYGALGTGTFGNLHSTSICDIILTEENTTSNGQTIEFDLTAHLGNIELPTDKAVGSGTYSYTFVGA